jgi:hypothetical protein
MAHKSFSIVASVGLPDLQGALSQNRHLNVTKIVTYDSYGALDFRGAGASGFAFIGRQLDPAKNENVTGIVGVYIDTKKGIIKID